MKSPTTNQILHFFYFINYLSLTHSKSIFLNCGSSTDSSIGLDGHKWTADSVLELSNETSRVSKSINFSSSLDPIPYSTARIFQSPFTYSFSVSPGQKFVRLYFNPCSYQGFENSTALFSVTSGKFTLLSHFNPSFTADSLGLKTLVKEFCLNIEERENTVLNITFSPSSTPLGAYAFINGIEIISSRQGQVQSYSRRNLARPSSVTKLEPTPKNRRSNKPNDRKLTSIIVGAALAASTVIFLLLGLTIFCLSRRGKSNAKDKPVVTRGLICRRFTLDELRKATNNFDRDLIIGKGGFGRVFKGFIDGETPVAIKALTPTSKQGSKEFEAEIKMLSDLRHPNLVSLIGYCDEEDVKIIVYEYMPRGTLRDHLCSTEGPLLSWKQRLEINIGIARGLKYLHAQNPKIIHRDIKPSNILLDENWAAKVSDFGLSRLGPTSSSRSHVTTGVKGTFGYLDPEYFQTSHLSIKSDVYSFGVVLFETLCGRPAVDLELDYEQQSLAEWVGRCIKSGKLKQIIDPNLKGRIASGCLKAYVSIALKCLNDDRPKRPTMSAVLKRLEHALELQECSDAASDDEVISSNDMEIVLRPNNNFKLVQSCPIFWNKTTSHKELFRFLSDKAGLKWARPPSLCGLNALSCAVPGYGRLSRNGQMSYSSDSGLYGTVPILLDDDDTFKL